MATNDRLRAVGDVLVAWPRFLTAPLCRHWHLRWGATDTEVAAAMPGDNLIPTPSFTATRAFTIAAPPAQVWPWLVQMGWHRGGWYTPRWLDRLLLPADWPSATQLVPDLQRPLQVGDRIPGGPPGTAWFAVERADPPKLLVLHTPPPTCPPAGGPGWARPSTNGRHPQDSPWVLDESRTKVGRRQPAWRLECGRG